MLSRIGDILPKCEIYQALFPSHDRLLQAISLVYLDVIYFCVDAKTTFRKFKRSKSRKLSIADPKFNSIKHSDRRIEVHLESFQKRLPGENSY